MAEFKDQIPHSGGQLTIRKQGNAYQLIYTHQNANRVALVELVAQNGKPVRWLNMVEEMQQMNRPAAPSVRIEFPTDAEAMWGRTCPHCKSYFRSASPYTEYCPYCGHKADSLEFLTESQKDFVKKIHDATIAAMQGPDGETTINFEKPDGGWAYADEKQQNHFTCARCELEFDVLGEYVGCPSCATRTARSVIQRKLKEIEADFEQDATTIPKDQRDQRQRRWRQHVVTAVAEFESLTRDIIASLAKFPHTPKRRKEIEELNVLYLRNADVRLGEWFGFELLAGLDEPDRTFTNIMVQRRHLFAHNAGKVDQEYLDKSGDTSVRLHETIRIDSGEVRRLVKLLGTLSANLLDAHESIA